MPTALTAVQVLQLSTVVDRVSIPRALKTLRDEAEARLLALEVQSADWKSSVHLATTAALAANTRTGNVLLANAVGALGNIDGVAPVVGRRYLIQFEGGVGAPHVNNGVYVLDDAGGATKFQFTRDTDFDESAEVTSDAVIPVELGTVYGGKFRKLTTTGAIAINVTAIAFDEFSAEAAIHPPVANNAGLIAIAPNDRSDGMLVVQLDTMQVWNYDAGSAAAASDWVVAPTDGVGRWLRTDADYLIHAPVADGAAVAAIPVAGRFAGMIVCRLDDNTIWSFNAASAEAASTTCIVPGAGAGRWLYAGARWGTLMQNRLRLLAGGAAAVAGNQVSIGGDTYEFNAATPPAGGTVGMIWVYNGANSLASRTNLRDAINGVVDAARITYPVAGVTEDFLSLIDDVTVGDLSIVSADAPGGTPVPSAVATACGETLATVTDIWDLATCRAGILPVTPNATPITIPVTAADIAKGTLQFRFSFAPRIAFLWNRNRANVEAYAIVGNAVSLTLGGGAAPNTQPADVIDVLAFR